MGVWGNSLDNQEKIYVFSNRAFPITVYVFVRYPIEANEIQKNRSHTLEEPDPMLKNQVQVHEIPEEPSKIHEKNHSVPQRF
jgi:hypothetical protein